jgi:thiol-disulfide isomerase/thioredoxin
MPLIELDGPTSLRQFLDKHDTTGCVVTFSAHWCGPCRQSKPALEQLASSSSNVGIVYEDALGEEIVAYKIRAFPTYVMYRHGTEVRRVEGANLAVVQSMVKECSSTSATSPFASAGSGEALGGGGQNSSSEEARAARLARLGGGGSIGIPCYSESDPTAAATAASVASTAEPMQIDEDADAKKSKDEDSPPSEKPASGEERVDDPLAKLDREALETLTSAMGFSLVRAQKGLLYGTGGTVEGAVDWLMVHQDDAGIDDLIVVKKASSASASTAGAVALAQSYKCNECGKILSNMANLELHANKTGHSDFEESTESVVPLTTEQKAAKIAEIKGLLKAKRAEREAAEKAEEKDREKQRRFMGQEMGKTREQLEIEQRKRDALLRKKEKEDARRERERIRAELAKDKAERAANKGKLQSRLGVEGYHPDGIQYDVEADAGGDEDDGHHHAAAEKKKAHASAANIDKYIDKVSGYKAGGDGGRCLKVLKAYVGNAADHPTEEKYKTIKMDNNAFRTKVKPFLGAKNILLAVGFSPNDEGDALVLNEDPDLKLLKDTKAKLEAAVAKYG